VANAKLIELHCSALGWLKDDCRSMCVGFTAPRGSKTRIHAMCNVQTARKSTVHNILDEVRKQQCGQG